MNDSQEIQELEALLREETGGEYAIERELGRGTFSVVYLATEIPARRRVAIKAFLPSPPIGPWPAGQFLHGAQAAVGPVFKRRCVRGGSRERPMVAFVRIYMYSYRVN